LKSELLKKIFQKFLQGLKWTKQNSISIPWFTFWKILSYFVSPKSLNSDYSDDM